MTILREMINSLPVSLNALTAILGILAALPVAWRFRTRLGLTKPWQVAGICLVFLIVFYYSTVLFYKFEALFGGDLEVSGTSLMGVFFVGAPVLLLVLKLLRMDLGAGFDIFTLCAVPGFFLARMHCLVADCCGGIRFFSTEWFWPTREAELVFFVVLFIYLWKCGRENRIPGQLFPIFMLSYGAFRFVNEFFRSTHYISTVLHLAHLWAALCVVVGVSIYLEMKSQADKKTAERNNRRIKA